MPCSTTKNKFYLHWSYSHNSPFYTSFNEGKRSNFCKDHRDKIEVPDPLVLEDLISAKLNNRRKLARLIKQYRDIFSNISDGTAFLLQGVTENDGSSVKRYKFKIWEIRYD